MKPSLACFGAKHESCAGHRSMKLALLLTAFIWASVNAQRRWHVRKCAAQSLTHRGSGNVGHAPQVMSALVLRRSNIGDDAEGPSWDPGLWIEPAAALYMVPEQDDRPSTEDGYGLRNKSVPASLGGPHRQDGSCLSFPSASQSNCPDALWSQLQTANFTGPRKPKGLWSFLFFSLSTQKV